MAILGYEGRRDDLAPHVIEETGLDGTSFYDAPSLTCAGELARDTIERHGVGRMEAREFEGTVLWRCHVHDHVRPAGVEVVAANLDKREVLDPAQLGDPRDLHLVAALGGEGGATTGLAALLAASNQEGSRGGGDLDAWGPLVGSWAGDHIGVIPHRSADGFTDISEHVRAALVLADEGVYVTSEDGTVLRSEPPWMAQARENARLLAPRKAREPLPEERLS